jgi:propionate CoA-transferase
VVNPKQWQTCEAEFNPALCGHTKLPLNFIEPLEMNIRKIVARRAAQELKPGYVVNLGIGMSDGVANVVSEQGDLEKFVFSVEQGIVGGVPVKGLAFGAGWNPTAIIAMCEQFDFYHGGGLDMACLGMAQVDQSGNVNVSKFGKKIPGSGGFIDISQNAKNVTFCGSFTSGRSIIGVKDDRLEISEEGTIRKFLNHVEQITFSGKNATDRGQNVLYVTERAVFELRNARLCLVEIAPGVDLERDILGHMDFKPDIADDLKEMDASLFRA